MPKVECHVSVFDGEETHPAGSVARLDARMAKKVVMLGMGELLDEDGNRMSFEEAARALAFTDDDLARATPVHRVVTAGDGVGTDVADETA